MYSCFRLLAHTISADYYISFASSSAMVTIEGSRLMTSMSQLSSSACFGSSESFCRREASLFSTLIAKLIVEFSGVSYSWPREPTRSSWLWFPTSFWAYSLIKLTFVNVSIWWPVLASTSFTKNTKGTSSALNGMLAKYFVWKSISASLVMLVSISFRIRCTTSLKLTASLDDLFCFKPSSLLGVQELLASASPNSEIFFKLNANFAPFE